MPRSLIKDPDKVVRAVLFGDKATAASLTSISKATGISVSTLSGYRRTPSKVTLERLALIAKARGLSGEEIGEAVRAYTGGKK